MEENLNYGIPAQGAEFTNQTMGNTFVGNEVNTFAADVEPAYVQEAVVQEPVVAEAQVYAPVEEAVAPQPVQAEPQVQIPEVDESSIRIIVETALLKEALRKADIVASKNELQPVTEVVMLRVMGKNLQVRASDKENILTVDVPAHNSTDGVVVTLKVAQFKQLIDKIHDDVVVLYVNGTTVTVTTKNGTYNFSQAVDLTTNEIIQIPDVDANSIPKNETVEITGESFIKPIESVLPLVASGVQEQYAAISIGDKVVSSNGDEVAAFYENLGSIFGTTALVKLTTIKDIVSMGVSDKIKVGFGTLGQYKTMCIYTDSYRLYSVLKEREDEYPLEEIENILSLGIGEPSIINKNQLLGTVERLSIFFASSLARQNLSFNSVGNVLEGTNESKATEKLVIGGNGNISASLDVKRLNTVLKAIPTDDVIIEPVISGDGPVTYLKVSSTDRKIVYVIAVSL